MERARKSGDYPLLSRGDINLYSLFVERAQALIKPTELPACSTPSGIASDLTASAFFKSVASDGRVHCIFDFENRRGRSDAALDFPGRGYAGLQVLRPCRWRTGENAPVRRMRLLPEGQCPSWRAPTSYLRLTASDFALVNPNTGTAPIFRTRRDADLTTAIYRRLPVLVRPVDSGVERKAWPVALPDACST